MNELSESPEPSDPYTPRALLVRVVLGMIGLVALAMLLTYLFEDQLTAIGQTLFRRYGLSFVFVGVALIDLSLIPLPNEPVLVFAVKGDVPVEWIAITASSASLLSANLGFWLGRGLAKLHLHEKILGMFTAEARRFVQTKGAWGVGLAALTPIPFAVCAWSAGALGMKTTSFVLASLLRVPKTLFYLWLIWHSVHLPG